MAKGWESKGVQEQQAEQENGTALRNSPNAELARARMEKQRARNELLLQRERVLNERTSSPHRRASLAAALEHLEKQLALLGEEA